MGYMTEPHRPFHPSSPQDAKPWATNDAPPPFPGAGVPSGSYRDPSYPTTPYDVGRTGRPGGSQPDGDERTWAMLAHLSAPIAAVVSAGWLTVAGPLVVWLLQKDRSPFVRNAAAGAFNFTLAMWLVSLLGWVFTFTIIGAVVGIPMIIIGSLGSIILGIVGAVSTWNGRSFTYPWQLRILS